MKKQALAVAVVLAISILAASEGLARPRSLKAHIPFTFEAGNRTLPGGGYQIEFVETGSGVLERIRRSDGGEQVVVSTVSMDSKGAPGARLVFHRYGNHYFLAQIWDGEDRGEKLSESKREREAASAAHSVEVAVALE